MRERPASRGEVGGCNPSTPTTLYVFFFEKSGAFRVGVLSEGVHPFSFRTRKLSLPEPMVLVKGRVGRRQRKGLHFFVFLSLRCKREAKFDMMRVMSWATKKKIFYAGIVSFAFLFVVFIFAYPIVNKAPSCTDGVQNQDEEGIDCGGVCDALCPDLAKPLIVHWSRVFRVQDGLYDAVAYVENQNAEAGARELLYVFKLYDDENILISEKYGKTFVSPAEQFAVFEGGIRTGERVPKKAFFEPIGGVKWERAGKKEGEEAAAILVGERSLDLSSRPRLDAELVNTTPLPVRDVSVTAVLYDKDDNAVAVSATYVPLLPPYEKKKVVFTWNEPFPEAPVRIDIIPRNNPFESGREDK